MDTRMLDIRDPKTGEVVRLRITAMDAGTDLTPGRRMLVEKVWEDIRELRNAGWEVDRVEPRFSDPMERAMIGY